MHHDEIGTVPIFRRSTSQYKPKDPVDILATLISIFGGVRGWKRFSGRAENGDLVVSVSGHPRHKLNRLSHSQWTPQDTLSRTSCTVSIVGPGADGPALPINKLD